MTIAEPVVEKEEALYYFEEFCIQPMRLNLSFVRTEKLESEDSRYVIILGYTMRSFHSNTNSIIALQQKDPNWDMSLTYLP